MKKVRLLLSQIPKDEFQLLVVFIQAASTQNFDFEWVEQVCFAAIANNCSELSVILFRYINTL